MNRPFYPFGCAKDHFKPGTMLTYKSRKECQSYWSSIIICAPSIVLSCTQLHNKVDCDDEEQYEIKLFNYATTSILNWDVGCGDMSWYYYHFEFWLPTKVKYYNQV